MMMTTTTKTKIEIEIGTKCCCRRTSWNLSCVNGLRSTRVVRCALLCVRTCSSVRSFISFSFSFSFHVNKNKLFVLIFSLRKGTGISQRDTNHYEFLNEPGTQCKIVSSFVTYWTAHVKPRWTGPTSCKFAILPSLTRSGSRFVLIVPIDKLNWLL
jgi:hypothetical protein